MSALLDFGEHLSSRRENQPIERAAFGATHRALGAGKKGK